MKKGIVLLTLLFLCNFFLYSQLDLNLTGNQKENIRLNLYKKILLLLENNLKKNRDFKQDKDFADYMPFLKYEDVSLEKLDPESIKNKIAELTKNITKKAVPTIESFNSGSLEVFGNGTTKAGVKLLKVRIGEPALFGLNRFSIPLYIFVSAKDESLTNRENEIKLKNKSSFFDLIDPLGGMINLSISDKIDIIKSKFELTTVSISYQACLKMITLDNVENEEKDRFFSPYFSAGLLFATGAWKENFEEITNMGRFFAHARISISSLSQEQLLSYFENSLNKTNFMISLEAGLFISDTVNLKVNYQKCLGTDPKNPYYSYVNGDVLKLSLEHYLNK